VGNVPDGPHVHVRLGSGEGFLGHGISKSVGPR
jgi:hypothetical protein